MAKTRIHEIAKEIGLSSKEILAYCATLGEEITSASSGVEEELAGKIKAHFAKSGETKQEASEAKTETAEVKKEASADEKKATEAKQAVEKTEEMPGKAKSEGERPADAPKKKKKPQVLIFTQNSRTMKNGHDGDRRQRGGNDQNRDRRSSRPEDNNSAHRPIRPRGDVHPSQRFARQEAEAAKAAQAAAAEETSAAAVEQEIVAAEAQTVENTTVNTAVNETTKTAGAENTAAQIENTGVSEPEIKRPVVIDRVDLTPKPAKKQNNDDSRRNRDSRPSNGEGRDNRNRNNRDGGDNRGKDQKDNRGRRNDRNDRGSDSRDNKNRQGRDGEGKRRTTVVIPQNEGGKDSRGRKNQKGNGKERQDSLGKREENYINLEKNGGKKKSRPQNNKPERNLDEVLTIVLPEQITIRELADKMKVLPADIVKKLFLKGEIVNINSEIDYDFAEEIALEYNCICEPEEKIDVIAELLKEDEEAEEDMITRPPVVCVMGHVDHGKTSLLDAIRDTRVTDKEAGGITQHIGASVVPINGQTITFLDTPGHEAFTAMRMRGANSTDIAILVVAADDGVMPQTVEAINHAKAAGIEIIVAINKIDKPGANVEKVKQELTEYELIPTDWGGSTEFALVSAKTKEGIQDLLELVLLTAEVLELKANPKRNARGLVIEAKVDKGRGVVATVLVQKGTLKVGDPIAAGSSFGKVRALVDDRGRRVKSAGPSTPVEILGLSECPNAGETFMAFESEKDARDFAGTFVSENKNKLIEETKAKMSLDDLFSQIQAGNLKELNLIVKADVQGSVEAVKTSLLKLSNDEVVVKVIHSGVGDIKESDVVLASASNAIIIGFNVKPDPVAKGTAETEKVDIRLYNVIYNAIEDIELAMKGMLDPVYEEKIIGHGIVRQVFKASGVGNIAGSYVTSGLIQRGCKIRLSRAGSQIFDGDLASLKRFKDDVKEVKSGFECGIVLDDFSDVQVDDEFEAYTMVEVPR